MNLNQKVTTMILNRYKSNVFDEVCKSEDVAKLEESYAELLALLKRTDDIIANATNAVYWKQIFELRGEITDVISKAERIQ